MLTSAAEAAAAAAGGPASLDSWVQRKQQRVAAPGRPAAHGSGGPGSGPFPADWDAPDDDGNIVEDRWDGGSGSSDGADNWDGRGGGGFGGAGRCAKWDADSFGETVCVAETPEQAAALEALQAKQARARLGLPRLAVALCCSHHAALVLCACRPLTATPTPFSPSSLLLVQRAQGSLYAKRREVEELKRKLSETQSTLHQCALTSALCSLTLLWVTAVTARLPHSPHTPTLG